MSRRDIQLSSMMKFLDEAGTAGKTAEATLVLGNEDLVTVRAGGPGVRSWPSAGPFETYEVLTAGDPPRFWQKYGDAGGTVYAYVPRLLLTHLVTRSGGIVDADMKATVRERFSMLSMRLMVADGAEMALGNALRGLSGVRVLSTRESPV